MRAFVERGGHQTRAAGRTPEIGPSTRRLIASGRMKAVMVEIQPIRVEIDREEDGRMLASVPDLPGVMAYGSTEEEAVRKVKSIALQVLADMIESGEDVPAR
jgi:predicted RNase H-like HicB family nuclease